MVYDKLFQLIKVIVCLPALPVLVGLLRDFDWLKAQWKDEHFRVLLVYVMAVFAVVLWHLFRPGYFLS